MAWHWPNSFLLWISPQVYKVLSVELAFPASPTPSPMSTSRPQNCPAFYKSSYTVSSLDNRPRQVLGGS